MIPTLRPHQQIDLDHLRSEVRAGRDPLLVAPCGYGKGTVISLIVKRSVEAGRSIVFAVHGKSLVHDMSQRVSRLGIDHGVLIGGHKRARQHKVQIASIDTMHRMEFPPTADYVIVDEAHMAASPTWQKALGRYPRARKIGMTATPCRLDGKGLGKATGGLFDSMITGPSEVDLIRLGYLVRSRVMTGSAPEISAKALRSDKQLAVACDKTTLIGDVVENYRKHASDRKAAAFGVDQKHAQHIAESFRGAGVEWAYVDADTPESERQAIWKDLDFGNLRGVSSVGCISVGWDHPIVSCLIMARPTASLGLWKQMLGRGSRPHPGKSEFIVLDHAGNTSRHAPYGRFEDAVEWSLDGDAVREVNDVSGPQVKVCWGPPVLMSGPLGSIRKFPCRQQFRAGPVECPFCGYPLPKASREVETVPGELGDMGMHPSLWAPHDLADGIQPVKVADRRSFLWQMVGVAKKRGFKSAWVKNRFREKFQAEPPRDWWPKEWREKA